MATPVEVPKLGNTVEECLVSKWVKRKGDVVAAGDIVAEIETDKATFEVAAPVAGTVIETFFEEGALVPVFTNLFVIGNAGETWTGGTPVQSAGLAEAPAPRAAATSPVVEQRQAPVVGGGSQAQLSPRARRF